MTGLEPTAPLALLPVGPASGEARAYVRDCLVALGKNDLLDNALLGVSELVTNACLHARTPITVAIRVTGEGAIRIEVTDDSPRLPSQRSHDGMAATGRGLRLLSLVGQWGIEPSEPPGGRKTVWFEPSADVDNTDSSAPDTQAG